MTKEEREALLKQIASSQDSENTLNLLQSVRSEFDAMDTTNSDTQSRIAEANKEVEKIRQNYIDRFFSAPIQQQKKEDEEDTKPKTFDQLFKMKGA